MTVRVRGTPSSTGREAQEDVARDGGIGVEEAQVRRVEGAELSDAVGRRRDEGRGARELRLGPREGRLDEERPVHEPAARARHRVRHGQAPPALEGTARERRQRLEGRGRETEDVAHGLARTAPVREDRRGGPVRTGERHDELRRVGVVDLEGEEERRDVSDEGRHDDVAGEPVRVAVRDRGAPAAAGHRRRGGERGAEVETRRRASRAGVGHGDARRAQERDRGGRIGERPRLAREKERARHGRRRGRRAGERGGLAAAFRRRRPSDSGSEDGEGAAGVARARDDVGARERVRAAGGAAPLHGTAGLRIDHPDGRDVRETRGPRKAARASLVAGGGGDRDSRRARGREQGRAGGILGVAEARVRRVVGEAEVDRVEVRGGRVGDGPFDGGEDVGRARRLAAVARAEDLEDDEAGFGRDALGAREDSRHLGAVSAAVGEISVAVDEIRSGPRRAVRREKIRVAEVDAAVDDPDAAAETGHADREQAIRADLRRAHLARGPYDAVEADVEHVAPGGERGDSRGRRVAGHDGREREPAAHVETRGDELLRRGGAPRRRRFQRHEHGDARRAGERALELRRHDARPRGGEPEGQRGGHREAGKSGVGHGNASTAARQEQLVCR